jgi:hypothetical protein
MHTHTQTRVVGDTSSGEEAEEETPVPRMAASKAVAQKAAPQVPANGPLSCVCCIFFL